MVKSVTGPSRARAQVVESGCPGGLPRRRWRRSLLVLAALLGAAPTQARSGRPAVAFFYGKSVPVAELSHFDWVVVEPENLDGRGLADLQAAGVQVFGYLSLGEAAPGAVEQSWVLGRNAGWGTVIVNPASSGWRERILDRAHALWERGYRGLFLDTLDSHVSALRGEEARRAAGAALAGLVRAIHDRHPEMKLFFNRGFEILDDVGRLACGVAAESLYFGWDAAAKRYVEVPEVDREWLAGRLRKVGDGLGIPVVVVDYLPPARREEARQAARRIEAMGFTPWISTPSLDVLGVGSVEVIPRRVLLLYDGAETPALAQSPIHRLAALPVEFLGYAADYLDVRRGLPQEPLAGRHAGIVTWFTDDDLPDAIGYPEWLARQIEAGVRVAMFARPGFAASKSFLARLGLAAAAAAPSKGARVVKRDGLVGLEAEPELRSRGLVAWHAEAPGVAVHLRIEDAQGRPIDPVVTAPWGGLAFEPYLLQVGYQLRQRWIVDPFAFLETALALPPAPALDLTTENGARLLVVSADGSGSAHPAGRDATGAAQAILREALTGLPAPPAGPGMQNLAGGGRYGGGPPSLTGLSPSGCPVGDDFEIYLPGRNANGASSGWQGSRFDAERFLDLVERTEIPRRLEPIGLAYHPGTRPAALRSLKRALRRVLERGALPLWSSEYAQRVRGFQEATVARGLDGTWRFRGLGRLRTVRLPRALGWPDPSRSRGVASVGEVGEWRYVSFGPEERPILALSDQPTPGPYLAWANAPLARWTPRGQAISLRLRGHGPVRLAVAGAPAPCTLTVEDRKIRPERTRGRDTFSLARADTGEARLECRME